MPSKAGARGPFGPERSVASGEAENIPNGMADAVEKALSAIEAAGGLVSAAEIAAEWGVTKPTVSKWIAAGRFPEPVKTVGRVRLYLRDQVEPFRPHG